MHKNAFDVHNFIREKQGLIKMSDIAQEQRAMSINLKTKISSLSRSVINWEDTCDLLHTLILKLQQLV